MNGFSDDNYIIDQDYFGDYEYRTMTSNRNGCGWIAAYNLRHYQGDDVDFTDVLHELDKMHTLRVPGPTTMEVMRAYLKKYVPDARESTGRQESHIAARESSAGILRFNEEGMPHFIFFMRVSGSTFRFLNVNDGLEDFEQDIDEFFEKHIQRFKYTAVFTV